MEQLNKVNQHNKLLKRHIRRKLKKTRCQSQQQNQALTPKARISTKDSSTKVDDVGKKPFRKQTADSDKTAQVTVQAIPASLIAELGTDQEHLDMDLCLHTENDNELPDSPTQVCLVIISNLPTAADFPIEIQGCKTDNLFNTRAQISCIIYDCYKEFMSKTKIDINIKAKVSSEERSNLGPIGVVICSLILGANEFE